MMCIFSSLHGDKRVRWKREETFVAYEHCNTTTKQCQPVVLNPTKYIFTVDDHSSSLTIFNLTTFDNGQYNCIVLTLTTALSSNTTLTVLNAVSPNAVIIVDSLNQVEYQDNQTVLMTASEQLNVTCTVSEARPPALIEWNTDVERIQVMDQINVVQGQSYVSQRVATITPSKDDHNKLLRCQAFHRDLQNVLQSTFSLYIQVLPRKLQLTSSQTITNQTGTNTLIVFENVPVIISCQYFESRPPVALSWELGPTTFSVGITFTSRPNNIDNRLTDGESSLRITPQRRDHFKFLRCSTPAGEWQIHEQVRIVVYGPPDPPEILNITSLPGGIPTSVTCIANNGYPAPVFQWNLGATDLTNESGTEELTNDNHRVMARSELTFIPNKKDHGRYLTCRVHHLETPDGWSRSTRIKITITYPPTIVDLSIRRSSSDDGNITVLFSCRVDARPKAYFIHWVFNGSRVENTSGVTINQIDLPERETLRTSTLMITNPKEFNEGEYLCEATTPLGSDSDALILNLSIPDPPSRLIVDKNQTTSSTLFVAWQPVFDGGYQQTFNLEYCPNNTAAKEEECGVITNLTQPPFTLDGLKAFTWYRLALWAENRAGNSSTVTAMASTAPLQPENYGVSITRVGVGQVLHIQKANQSLGEVCFVLKSSNESCALLDKSKCIYPTKGIKEVSVDAVDDVVVTYGRGLCSEPANIYIDQPGPTVPSSDQGTPYMIIAIGVIASISVIIVISLGLTYFYGLMCCTKRKKVIELTISYPGFLCIPLQPTKMQLNIKTEGQGIYTELAKDRPSHSSGPGTSYYMDLKPTNPTSTAVATSDGRGDHDYDTPNVSNTAYMDADSKDGHRPNHDYVSPSSSPKGSESHYMNTDGMVLESESDGHQSINHLYTGGDGDETTTHIYMDMKPMQMPSTSLGVSSVEDDTPDEEEVVYANT
ncbi:synaptogenesis protein syg-2-like [Lytechinus variegatus]|uniref:synaptogenesis protein syg-2-like n=1 Tax=Lytechinus variegatus TaxID=7654 RepID=UPI001BB25C41|nr:synaptogenesis protein syg-2-like [Lytechinus variegatus]